jgi:hypothetical protein
MSDTERIVKALVANGKVQELLDLLTGEVDASRLLTNPESVADKILLSHAVAHLSYLRDFPGQTGLIEQRGKVYSDHPQEFQDWLRSGTPGLNEAALAGAGLLSLPG